jgi:hypothetical protein
MNHRTESDSFHLNRGTNLVSASGRLRMPPVIVAMFGAGALFSAELFSHFTESGASLAMTLVALLPLQAVALIWYLSQRTPKDVKPFRQAD